MATCMKKLSFSDNWCPLVYACYWQATVFFKYYRIILHSYFLCIFEAAEMILYASIYIIEGTTINVI